MTAANALPADALVRRLPPPPSAVAAVPDLPSGIPQILRFTEDDEWQEQRSVLFSIEDKAGNRRDYTVLDNPTPDMALEYMDVCRRQGVIIGASHAFEVMLGPEGHAALRGHKGLRLAQLSDVTKAVTEKLIGALEDGPKGG